MVSSPFHLTAAASVNLTQLGNMAHAGLWGYSIVNTALSTRFVKFYWGPPGTFSGGGDTPTVGTDIPAITLAIPPVSGLGTPLAAPTLSSVAGGSLAAATYFTKITYVNNTGETLASPESSLAVALANLLVVSSPSASANATGYNVYVSTSTGTETKQNSIPISIGTNWTEPTSGLVAGSALPSANTAEVASDVVQNMATGVAGQGNMFMATTVNAADTDATAVTAGDLIISLFIG
ncbi:MAG: hypothetical protein KGL39_13885 [Patescibacteria group bacterium]|nr:hypothetical protein [Patescibacteria group bacterium]